MCIGVLRNRGPLGPRERTGNPSANVLLPAVISDSRWMEVVGMSCPMPSAVRKAGQVIGTAIAPARQTNTQLLTPLRRRERRETESWRIALQLVTKDPATI